jgi:hypothetical protein
MLGFHSYLVIIDALLSEDLFIQEHIVELVGLTLFKHLIIGYGPALMCLELLK